jgi:hypothetical protein
MLSPVNTEYSYMLVDCTLKMLEATLYAPKLVVLVIKVQTSKHKLTWFMISATHSSLTVYHLSLL